MNTFLNKACFVMRELLGVAVIALLAIGANRLSAEEPLPSQDEAIARAVENHPDIVAAKAKLALAESELNGKRMEVSRQVLQAYSSLQNSEALTSAIKAKLDAVHREFDALKNAGAQVSATEVEQARAALQAQEAALVQAMLQREQTGKELRLLIGTTPTAATNAGSPSKAATRQVPQGPTVDKIRWALLNNLTSVDVADQPLSEWCQYITDKYQFPIQLHPDLKQTKDPATTPIGVTLRNVPLPAVFQAIEDVNNGKIQFVVRDYGILLVDHSQAQTSGFMPLSEFVREAEKNATANRSETRK
jgi:hypothetical protein